MMVNKKVWMCQMTKVRNPKKFNLLLVLIMIHLKILNTLMVTMMINDQVYL